LAQTITHVSTTTITGGESVYGFFVNTSGGSTNYTTTTTDLSLVRDMGTSILSGGNAAGNVNIYPDGPDVITIMATNLTASTAANIAIRLSWTEAQA